MSMPFTFFMSNDAFYYGVLPVLAEAASHYGITAVEMARASIVGQPVHLLSPLVPSTYLLVALAGIEFGDHQRFTPQVGSAGVPVHNVRRIADGDFSAVQHSIIVPTSLTARRYSLRG